MNLKYVDDTDKSYGLAGVAVSMFIYESDEFISSLSLESEDEISFVPEFFVAANTDFSPKSVWAYRLKQYEMFIAMTCGNYLCRQLVLNKKSVDPFAKAELRKIIVEEGKNACSLGDDEIDGIFNKGYSNMQRVFSHPGVQTVVKNFAGKLAEMRQLSHDDIIAHLHALQNL